MIKTLFVSVYALALSSAMAGTLKPLELKPGKVVYQNDFQSGGELDKARWQPRQGTRWSIAAGVLQGIPSTPEYQARKKETGKGHLGTVPRIYLLDLPRNFILSYRFKLEGGKPSKLIPMFEFGHHVTRVYFGGEDIQLLIDHEKTVVDSIKGEKIEQGKWYEVLAEMKDDSIVVQVEGIGMLKAKDPFIGETDRPIAGITGCTGGTIQLDDILLTEAR